VQSHYRRTDTVLTPVGNANIEDWRDRLRTLIKEALAPRKLSLNIPEDFPKRHVVRLCFYPTVSPDQTLRTLPCLTEWNSTYTNNPQALFQFLLKHFHSRRPFTWPVQELLPIELNNLMVRGDKLPDIVFEKQGKKQAFVTTVSVVPGDIFTGLDRLSRWHDKGPRVEKAFFTERLKVSLLDCVLRERLPDEMEEAQNTGPPGNKPTGSVNNSNAAKKSISKRKHAGTELRRDLAPAKKRGRPKKLQPFGDNGPNTRWGCKEAKEPFTVKPELQPVGDHRPPLKPTFNMTYFQDENDLCFSPLSPEAASVDPDTEEMSRLAHQNVVDLTCDD